MKTLARILLVLACAVAPVIAADTVELKQRWVANKQYFFSAQTSQQSTFSMGPQKMVQNTAMTMEMNVAVRPLEDGKRKRLAITYDRVAMEMSMNGQKMGYDSAQPDASTDPGGLGKTLGLMIGKELKFLTNEKDEMTEAENLDEFVKQLTAGGGPAAQDMSKMFSRDGFQQMMKQGSLQAFPGHPVAAGESWPFTNQINMPPIGSVTVKGTYTFKGMVDRGGVSCAEIATEATIAMDMNGEGKAAGGEPEAKVPAAVAAMGMKLIEGTLKGTIWFDPQLGAARDSELVQEITMDMKNPADAGEVISIPLKQTIKTTLTKVADLK